MSTVDAWLVPVTHGAADDPGALALLDATERARVARMGFAGDRDRVVTARVAARRELGRRLGLTPARVPLITAEDGCPGVEGRSETVSWSHSGRWIAIAIAGDRRVGIDIERIPDTVPAQALARIGVRSLEEFVGLEAAGKATRFTCGARWPPGVTVRPLCAPIGYLAAVAAPGDDWTAELHLRAEPVVEQSNSWRWVTGTAGITPMTHVKMPASR